MEYEYWQRMEEGISAAVEAAGYEYVLHDQAGDATEMVTGCENLIDQGIAGLIISPVSPGSIGSIVDKANEAGIPVVIADVGNGETAVDALVVSNNYDGGVQAADYLGGLIKDNGVESNAAAVISCESSALVAVARTEGFKAEAEAAGLEVVSELIGNSNTDEAYECMNSILVSNPEKSGQLS